MFARGAAAVLVVADGSAADLVLERARDAALDEAVDLLTPKSWIERIDGSSSAAIVVLVPGKLVHALVGASQAWLVGPSDVARLTGAGVRGDWEGRLVMATGGLFERVPETTILRLMRAEKFGRVSDSLLEILEGDAAVLVAER